MAKFKFAFDSLKKMRHSRLLLARKDMIEVEGRLRNTIDQSRNAMMERVRLFDTRDEGKLSNSDLRLTMELITGQTQKMGQLDKKISVLEAELERHRNWVAHLGKELRIVEKLEEKQRAEFELNERMKEKRLADRWVSENWIQRSEGAQELKNEQQELSGMQERNHSDQQKGRQ